MMCVVFLSFVCVLQASEAFRRGEFNVFLFLFFPHGHAPLYMHEGIFYVEGFCLDNWTVGGGRDIIRYLISLL